MLRTVLLTMTLALALCGAPALASAGPGDTCDTPGQRTMLASIVNWWNDLGLWPGLISRSRPSMPDSSTVIMVAETGAVGAGAANTSAMLGAAPIRT